MVARVVANARHQRQGWDPELRYVSVGETLVYSWNKPGFHIIVRLAALHVSGLNATADFEVSHVEGPAPTKVGPLKESEFRILSFLATSPPQVKQPALEERFAVDSVLDKRQFEHQLRRLEEAGLIVANRQYTTDQAYTYTIARTGIQYLLDAGLLE